MYDTYIIVNRESISSPAAEVTSWIEKEKSKVQGSGGLSQQTTEKEGQEEILTQKKMKLQKQTKASPLPQGPLLHNSPTIQSNFLWMG